jgi:hypothetical protein
VTAIGIAFRLKQYAYNRSLRVDEAMLALNIMNRSPTALTQQLDFHQGAPFGFLWLEWAVGRAWGYSEPALRALPLAAAVASALLFARLALRLPGMASVIAVALFALDDAVIFYASDLKQYALDVAVSIAFVLMGMALLEDRLSARRSLALALGGAIFVWFSHPSVFLVAGVGGSVAVASLARRRRRSRAYAVVCAWALSGLTMVALLPNQLASIRGSVGDTQGGAFPAAGGGFASAFRWLAHVAGAAARGLGMPTHGAASALTAVAAVIGLVGAMSLFRRQPVLAAMLLSPLLPAAIASWLHHYPLSTRTLLFTLPAIAVCVAAGMGMIAAASPSPRAATFALVFVVLAAPAWKAGGHLVHPRAPEQIKPVLAHVRDNWHVGDVLYVNDVAQYAFAYYEECACTDLTRLQGQQAPLWPIRRARPGGEQFARAIEPRGPTLIVGQDVEEWAAYLRAVTAFRGHRVWVLTTAPANVSSMDDLAHRFDALLARRGQRLGSYSAPGALVRLFDFRSRPGR